MFKTVLTPFRVRLAAAGNELKTARRCSFSTRRCTPRPAASAHRRQEVPVVYDFVGHDTFLKSLDCPAPLGVAALFGQSSGAVDPLKLGLLAAKARSMSRARHSTPTAHSR